MFYDNNWIDANTYLNMKENSKKMNEQDLSIRLSGRFTRINPKFNKLKDRYEKNRGISWQTPLSQPQGLAKVLRIPDFSGISEKYQEDVLKSIFDNFIKNEDLPKDFFEFLLSDARFSNATLHFVKNNKLEETYSRMFEVFEDHVSSLLDEIIQSDRSSFVLNDKLTRLKILIMKFLTPALKAKLLAGTEVIKDFRESEFDLSSLISPSILTEKQIEKESQQRAEQELKEVLSGNKTKVLNSLKNIANNLDNKGLYKEANSITKIMVRLSKEMK